MRCWASTCGWKGLDSDMSFGLAKEGGPKIALLEPTICQVTNHSYECGSSLGRVSLLVFAPLRADRSALANES